MSVHESPEAVNLWLRRRAGGPARRWASGSPLRPPVEQEAGSSLWFPELDLLCSDTGAPGPQGLDSDWLTPQLSGQLTAWTGLPGLLSGVDRFLPHISPCTCLRAPCRSFLWGALACTASHLQHVIPKGWWQISRKTGERSGRAEPSSSFRQECRWRRGERGAAASVRRLLPSPPSPWCPGRVRLNNSSASCRISESRADGQGLQA